MLECGFIGEDQSFYETIVLHFELHLLATKTGMKDANLDICLWM
jgi:hypothetical protein